MQPLEPSLPSKAPADAAPRDPAVDGAVYDAAYYREECGLPYDRSEPHWPRFFGAIADRIVAGIAPRTVLDAGCAMGFLVGELRARGVEAAGLDLSAHAVSRAAPAVRPYLTVGSIAEPLPAGLARRWDLVTCIEVLEHLPAELAEQAVATLCAHTDDLLFSSSPSDFREPTHRNVQPVEAWAERFARHGLIRDLDFDASFVTPWAVRLRRRRDPLPRVVRDYERDRARLEAEARELRGALHELRRTLDREREAATGERRALLAQVEEARRSTAMVMASPSWRLTAPLRRAKHVLRALLQGGAVPPPPAPTERLDHAAWAARFGDPTPDERRRIEGWLARTPRRPVISVLLPVCDPPPGLLERAIASVEAQLYPDWELCIADDASAAPHVRGVLDTATARDPRVKVVHRAERGHIAAATNGALGLATGEWCTFLDHDDELAPHALFCVAAEVLGHPEVELVYSDEDKLDEAGRRYAPAFKPTWDPELLRSCNYVGHLMALKTARVRALGGLRPGLDGAQDLDLLLRYAERLRPDQVRRAPFVLYHWRALPGSEAAVAGVKPYAGAAVRRAVQEHLERLGVAATVEAHPDAPTWTRVRYAVPSPAPLASIVICTRDRGDLLRRCIDSLARTTYTSRELIVVDNGSQEPATLAYLLELELKGLARVLRRPGEFNFSALNNDGAAQAEGDVLVLLNNDTEVVSPDWLTELVAHAVRPEVGAVGPRLLYPDGTIQHAGVVLGLGTMAGHMFCHLPADTDAAGGRARATGSWSGLTAACVAMRKEVWDAVGGLDPGYPVAFGDIDLCLRIRERGWWLVHTPFVRLVHHESASRGKDDTWAKQRRFAAEVARLQARWPGWIQDDPAWSPNLALDSADPVAAVPPRTSLASRYLAGVP